MASIVMYAKDWCPFCQRAKRLLADKGQTWEEIDVEAEPERLEEMVERSGRRTVPQIWVDDHHVGGFQELSELATSGELDAML